LRPAGTIRGKRRSFFIFRKGRLSCPENQSWGWKPWTGGPRWKRVLKRWVWDTVERNPHVGGKCENLRRTRRTGDVLATKKKRTDEARKGGRKKQVKTFSGKEGLTRRSEARTIMKVSKKNKTSWKRNQCDTCIKCFTSQGCAPTIDGKIAL